MYLTQWNDRKSKLQELRKLAGLTQKELSERSGVNLRTLQPCDVAALDAE